MITNYHTHTWRCKHAEADERAFVESALSVGTRVLGFSDHTPYPFDDGYCSGFRMPCDQVGDYVRTIAGLKEEYKGEIDIHIGFEAEYYPAYFDRLLTFLEPWGYEYLILGQHFLNNELGETYIREPTEDVSRLRQYVHQVTEAMHTGAFSCIAHPDILGFVGDEKIYRQEMRALCREAKACGIPLEINLLGLGTGRRYPREDFWEEAAVVGNQVILGWDAHQASWMNQPALEAEAERMVERLGLHRINYLTLVRPTR